MMTLLLQAHVYYFTFWSFTTTFLSSFQARISDITLDGIC
jgi:hypothetical protein